jgi:hypothetical protein
VWSYCGHIVVGRRREAPGRKGVRSGPGELESTEKQKMKNSGNELKKYLKINDLTFFGVANFARFVSISA